MSKLSSFALNNQIDVPYFSLSNNNTIALIIKKGKVLDDEMLSWINLYSKYILRKTNGYELNNEEKTILAYLYKSERINDLEKYTVLLNKDNNHFVVIKDLERYKLIYPLYTKENEIVYVIDRTLIKKNYTNEVRFILGGDFDLQSSEIKEIIETVYKFNSFSVQDVSANIIGNFLYLSKNISILDLKSYENYKRKIRAIFNKLEKSLLLTNIGTPKKPNFIINKNFERKPSLFD